MSSQYCQPTLISHYRSVSWGIISDRTFLNFSHFPDMCYIICLSNRITPVIPWPQYRRHIGTLRPNPLLFPPPERYFFVLRATSTKGRHHHPTDLMAMLQSNAPSHFTVPPKHVTSPLLERQLSSPGWLTTMFNTNRRWDPCLTYQNVHLDQVDVPGSYLPGDRLYLGYLDVLRYVHAGFEILPQIWTRPFSANSIHW
jgi:hypothetical protein